MSFQDEDLFPLSFAQHALATPASHTELDSLIHMPPPALSNSPNGSSEPDWDWTYQRELEDDVFQVDTEPLETPYSEPVVIAEQRNNAKTALPPLAVPDASTADEFANAFADAAQHNYRLWLASF